MWGSTAEYVSAKISRTWPRETTLCQESTLNLVMLGRFCQQLIDFGRERESAPRKRRRSLTFKRCEFIQPQMNAGSITVVVPDQEVVKFYCCVNFNKSLAIQKASSSKFSFIKLKFNYCSFRVSKITIVIHNNFCNTYNGQFMTFLSF